MRQDILLEDFDLATKDGDIAVGSSAQQEAELIAFTQKGEWRQAPFVGFGIENYLKKRAGANPVVDSVTRFKRDYTVQLESDGLEVESLEVNSDLSIFKLTLEDER